MPIGKLMITNGGPHPSDKWAETTAEQICDLIQIDENSDSPEAKAARLAKPRLKLDLTEALDPHHDTVQKHERGKLAEHGFDRLSHALAPEAAHVEAAVAAVIAKTAGTPFAAHFAQAEVKAIISRMIAGHFATAIDIDRSTHADKHPDHEHARAYRVARHHHGALLVNSYIERYRHGASPPDHGKR